MTTVTGADIDVDGAVSTDELRAIASLVSADGPFEVTAVDEETGRRRCSFAVRRPGLAVGFRSLIDLQYRLDRFVTIVGVSTRGADVQPSPSTTR